ncbi:MAG: hypothetical protein U1F43_12170 [Myxococcota bacterium]
MRTKARTELAPRARCRPRARAAAALAILLWSGGCADETGLETGPARNLQAPGGVDLIGVSGHRLNDGDSYRVPLDYDDVALPPGVARREAFVIWNSSDAAVVIEHLSVVSTDLDADIDTAAEWQLFAPIRARDIPLAADGIRLVPDAHLDFDVGVTPAREGERHAELHLVMTVGGRTEVRIVALGARCARGPPQ